MESRAQETLYEPEEVADRFRVKLSTVYTWIRRGQLRAVKLGVKCIRIPESAYQEFLKTVEPK